MLPDLLISRAPEDEDTQAGCKLLDSFAIAIQICLATIAFSTLIIKRQRENPQRPLRIWQVITYCRSETMALYSTNMTNSRYIGRLMLANSSLEGSLYIHWICLYPISQAETSQIPVIHVCGKQGFDIWHPAPFQFLTLDARYFLNIFVDTTVGVGILWGILLAFQKLAVRLQLHGVKSGVYGDPPLINQFVQWGKQLFIYNTALVLMKFVVVLIFAICPFLFTFGQWVLEWTMSNYKLQVVFVMLM